MKPEEGGSWFFLLVEPHGVLIESVLASSQKVKALIEGLQVDGISPVLDNDGALKAVDFHEEFSPYSIPESVKAIAQFISPGTVITLDNGCLPSVEWRFKDADIEVFDTYDYVSD